MTRSMGAFARRRKTLVTIAGAAIGVLGVAGCGSGSHPGTLAARAVPRGAAPSVPMIPVPGTPISVPAELPGYVTSGPTTRTFGTHRVTNVNYDHMVTGGPPGASDAGVTFAIFQDQSEHDALRAKNMAVPQLAAHDASGKPTAPTAHTFGSHVVAFWPVVAITPGAVVGRPDRITSRYEFASGGDWVVQVHADGVDPQQVQQLIAEVVA